MDDKKKLGSFGKRDDDDDDKPRIKRADDDDDRRGSGGKPSSPLQRRDHDDDHDKPRVDADALRRGAAARDDDKPHASSAGMQGQAAAPRPGVALPHAALTPEAQAKIDELQTQVRDFINRINLTSIASRVTSLASKVNMLPANIQAVRGRGYTFRAFLEAKAGVLAQQFNSAQAALNMFLQQESQSLREDLDRAQHLLEDLQARRANPNNTLPTVTSILDNLQAKLKAAEDHVASLVSTLEREIGMTDSQLNEINWVLEQKEQISFQLFAGEAIYTAAQAEWDDGDKKPDGILFLTDKRLVFEQKETVGGGLFRKGEQKQGMLWEAPLSTIQEVKPEDKGLFGGKDMVHLKLQPGGRYNNITVEIKGGIDSKVWAAHIQRVMTGSADGERTVQADPQLQQRLRNAPTQCPTCGGILPTVMAGQNEVHCSYCSTIVRL
ncbi:MAG: hypothetical protein U0694_13905 [Anaerolineae bacterium]